MRKILRFISIFICFFTVHQLYGQDFVYKPVNPAFGGETFNYQWMLSSAEAQNLLEQPVDLLESLDGVSSLDDFTESLNRQLLNQISRQIATTQFGTDGLEAGSYTVGNFQIDIFESLEGLNVTIFDASAGEQTQIVIPFF